jgi:hypothetical protein
MSADIHHRIYGHLRGHLKGEIAKTHDQMRQHMRAGNIDAAFSHVAKRNHLLREQEGLHRAHAREVNRRGR